MNMLLGILPLSIVVGLLLPHHVDWSWWTVGLLVSEGLMIGIYNKLAFRAIKRLPISHFQTLNQTATIFIILLGWILLGEKLNLPQIFGISLILTGAVLSAFAARAKAKKKLIEPGTVEMVLLATFILAVGLVSEKAALGHMDIGAYFMFGFGAQTLFASIIAAKDVKKDMIQSINWSDLRNIIVFGVCNALAGYAYIYTVRTANNISLVVSLNSFVLPLTALASYWLLHEREDMRKLWVAIGLGVVGILVTAL